MRQSIWSSDGFIGSAFVLAFLIVAYGVFGDSFQNLERYTYDTGMRATTRTPAADIAVIAVDDESIANIGRWPWPRDTQAKLIELLNQGGARLIVSTILYSEAQRDPGLKTIDGLVEFIQQSPDLSPYIAAPAPPPAATLADSATAQDMPVEDTPTAIPPPATAVATNDTGKLVQQLVEAQRRLDTDRILSESMKQAGNVYQGMTLTLGYPEGRPDHELPPYVQANQLRQVTDELGLGDQPLLAVSAQPPIALIGESLAGMGHIVSLPDVDGARRQEPLVVNYFNSYLPSLSLIIAARALNLNLQDIDLRLGVGVQLGQRLIETTPDLQMYTYFYSGQVDRPAFAVDSFFDVLSGKISPQKYQDKIVLIGATAQGVGDSFATPISPNMPPVVTLAHTVSSLIQGDYLVRPFWADFAEPVVILVIGLYLAFLLPRLKASLAFGISLGLALAFVATELYLFINMGYWLKLMIPTLLLLSGHLFMTVKQFSLTERLKTKSETEGAESNKMLGLAFQGQGQLDMAFEKFRRVQPIDDALLDVMYNLALDYERKRQFNKAGSVYEYMSQHKPGYRDLKQKLSRAKQLEETIILGAGGGGSTAQGTLIMQAGSVEKPMLGRYQIEKELGRGAMGMVYLGKDPKIGRQVAIKTMALSQEFEASELQDVKDRFFREAETAGKLHHPHIVTMFDAGEEHDLAFIAMEFIKGHDLTRYVKLGTLLDRNTVVQLMIQAAEALDYAHRQKVVHRDIKPANLMYLPDDGQLKITDFGIARVTDSSKTKTGTVLGTPSYMSPEQLAGKHVDGRSDLFSLAVTTYQLLTGQLPFVGESMATLMYKITNETQISPREIRNDLPAALDPFMEKALQKDADKRFLTGAEFAAGLRNLGQ